MTRLVWGVLGERFYEIGIDRGVLYVNENPGVAWSGLISVSESPTGGDAKAFYIDGFKYLNIASAEEFEATLEAFSSPPEFAPCDGVSSIQNGLFATQQPRRPFNLSYRTRVGNGVDGDQHGYKIHLVYNALAAPSQLTHSSMGESVDPTTHSWAITTLPPAATGIRPTAHFVIDSRSTSPELLTTVEDILYGNESVSARLPSVEELMDLFMFSI